MTLTVVTDSTADLPAELARSLGIEVVPLTVMFGSESFSDGETIGVDEFYERLGQSAEFPTTSQPSPGQFIEKYRAVGEQADEILSIHLSGELSRTYNSALQAARELGDDGPHIEVVDSRTVSMGQGLIVIAAARAAQQGAGLDEVAALIRDLIERTQVFFLLDTLENLRRGGRIGRASAFLGTLLRFHPILTVADGVVHPLERPRSRKRGIARLIALVEAALPIEAVAVCTSGDRAAAEEVAGQLGGFLAEGEPVVSDLGPVVGAHAGPGAIGVTMIRRQAN